MADEQRQQGTDDKKPGKAAGGTEAAPGRKRPDDGIKGKAPRPEDGGSLQDWDPDTTNDGRMGGGGAGGAGGVTGGASGRSNSGDR